jgi:hypothetical protein
LLTAFNDSSEEAEKQQGVGRELRVIRRMDSLKRPQKPCPIIVVTASLKKLAFYDQSDRRLDPQYAGEFVMDLDAGHTHRASIANPTYSDIRY